MRKVFPVFLVVIALTLASVAQGGPLDDFYLKKFGFSSAAPATGVSLTGEPVPDRCRTWLNHDLRRDWNKLLPETQKVLSKVLPARPALSGEAVVLSNGGHFHIHYATSGTDAPPPADADGNKIPDWIETVAKVFEAVYNTEVTGMGYNPPPPANSPYDIYLRNLGSDPTNAEFGETDSDAAVTSVSFTSYIIIDNDFSAAEFGNQITNYTPEKALEITAAHEFHHAIQYGYNLFFESWYAEAMSTWMEDEVYDSVDQLYGYLHNYLTNTTAPVNIPPDVTTGGGYARWIFNRYLAEVFTPAALREVWTTLGNTPAPGGNANIPMLPIINQVLQPLGSSLDSAFIGFDRRLLLRNWLSHQDEIRLIPQVTAQPVSVSNNAFAVPASTLPAYSFIYYRLSSTSATPATLTITNASQPSTVAAAFLSTGNGAFTEFDATSGTITVPGFSSGADVILIVTNNVSGTAAFPNEPTPVIEPPAEATNPFTGPATIVSSPSSTPTPAPSSSGGGGGGCFIATAAYGSYLHPKVQVLRNFRDEYLMKTAPGRAFVALYYRLSPPMADFIARHDALRAVCRVLLAPVVFGAEHVAASISMLAAAVLGGMTWLFRLMRYRCRERFQK